MSRILILIAAVTLSLTSSADASYLYWTSTSTKAERISTCLRFAKDGFSDLGYKGIRFTPGVEVSGSKSGVYVAVTCIGTQPRATAVVMGMGGDGKLVNKLQAELAQRISLYFCFTGNCD
ncbi:hypothetical protein FNU79_12000 [Deinococcus detaillensis]|uniref:Uncharacterized protein n=1 Tax=Deinococcus detaillensis TaxID=2592048 RepID=A0A553UU36_9DEIO|nr:hypothetical protein [Deinococcus detaillensis]TSA83720.1 hypothetical protein FNU79_12000 [Deinococcus detaillensis]